MNRLTNVSPVFAGMVGKPNAEQLTKVLDVLDTHDSVILVSGKTISRSLMSLINSYGFLYEVRKDLSNIDSLYVFDDPDMDVLLSADAKQIPIYASQQMLVA